MKLEEIEKLCEEATTGPWYVFLPAGEEDSPAHLTGPRQFTEFRFGLSDAKFIAASRELIPKLLAVVKAVEKMKKESLAYHNWYALVSSEFAEEVDKALEDIDPHSSIFKK